MSRRGMKLGVVLVAGLTAVASATAKDSIYYKSQKEADAALAAFDRDNPDCQLWTNWQKMCSRTGENGATWCTTDPDKPVKPSTPFCEAPKGSPDRVGDRYSFPPTMTKSQIESANRFCLSGISSKRQCKKLDPTRPFNGKRLAARRHPWCEIWGDETALLRTPPVCSETTDIQGVPKCAPLAQKGYKIKGALYCAKIGEVEMVNRFWCRGMRGKGYGPSYPLTEADFISMGATRRQPVRIAGIFCDWIGK
jgi:hypothetical protein